MLSCECCKKTFCSMQSLDRHNASNLHKIRLSSDVKKYTCDCGKSYIHQPSLRNHKMKCSFAEVVISATSPSVTDIIEELKNAVRKINQLHQSEHEHQQQMDELKHAFEKERQEMKITFEKTMKTQIDKIHILETHIRTISSSSIGEATIITQVPMKRRKINKALKQQIVNEQNNACGECKLALTPYYQLDHMIGLQFGGTDDRSNLMALCCECHAKKSIGENKCRKRIQDAIQDILRENRDIITVTFK